MKTMLFYCFVTVLLLDLSLTQDVQPGIDGGVPDGSSAGHFGPSSSFSEGGESPEGLVQPAVGQGDQGVDLGSNGNPDSGVNTRFGPPPDGQPPPNFVPPPQGGGPPVGGGPPLPVIPPNGQPPPDNTGPNEGIFGEPPASNGPPPFAGEGPPLPSSNGQGPPLFGFASSKPDKQLGEPCSQIGDCSAAFAHCVQGTCACIAGFSPEGETCVSQQATCPFAGGQLGEACTLTRIVGEPQPGAFPPSRRSRRQITAAFPLQSIFWDDSCSDGSFCSLHDPHQAGKGIAVGHCCPLPAAQCPVGQALSNATCGTPQPGGSANPCPILTHYCYTLHVSTNPGVVGSKCCPRPCMGEAIYKDGKCWSPVPVGQDGCQVDEQCAVFNGKCNTETGKCECPKGTVLQQGFCSQVFCQGGSQLLKPLLTLDGDLISCNDSSVCSTGNGYCARDRRICCPKPEPYCPPFVVSKEVGDLCDPDQNPTEPSSCGQDKLCFRYIVPTEPQQGGVCCDRQVLSPPPNLG